MKYLLDTNVISETNKPKCHENVKLFMENVPYKDLYLSTITLGEISKGAENHPADKRKHDLLIWLYQTIPKKYKNRIINIDREIMCNWGRLDKLVGRTLPILDSIIAAVAITYNLVLVTRNVKDYQDIPGLIILNPWEYEAETENKG